MLKDRAQKASALRFCVSKRWLPQIEVEVEPSRRMEKTKALLTDLDVLAVAPSPVGGNSRFVFDCKSGLRESAIARTFWVHGVITRVTANHGFVVLNDKVVIARDHRISAADLGVSLLHESELPEMAKGMGGSTLPGNSSIESVDAWDALFAVPDRYPNLSDFCRFSRSSYWMLKDHGEQCRKTVARLRAIRGELDPAKAEHLAVFGDALCLFLLALSELSNSLFLVLFRPKSREEFSSSLLALVYGGHENLEMAHRIRRVAAGSEGEGALDIFPELMKFEQLVREILQAPQQVLNAAILARELCLCFLVGSGVSDLQKALATETSYAPKFLFMASDYLQKALRLPPEFSAKYSEAALTLTAHTLSAHSAAT